MGELAAANDLAPPYILAVGQVLILPQPRIYQVRSGDNLYRISKTFGVPLESLAAANGITPPYTIFPGQRLVVPDAVPVSPPPDVATEEVPLPSASAFAIFPPPPTPSPPAPPPSTEVQSESLLDVAILSPPPAATEPPPPSVKPQAPARLADAPARASSPPAGPRPAASGASTLPSPPPELLQPDPRQSSLPAGKQPPPLAPGGFLWPVRGNILATFGRNPGGLHNDGINIAAPRGTPVVAAQSGVVIYSGNGIEGFGKLLIIKHADGWSTAYGHNDILLVKRGDTVTRGETVARVGSTGDVDLPQLHFEIRKKTKAVNPFDYLTASSAPTQPSRVAVRDVRQGLE